jgi:hypothetical protein
MNVPTVESGQWEFMQTRAVKWKWRQLGSEGILIGESPEFAFLAQCMKDAERNGFSVNDHVINCEKGAALWSEAPAMQV